MEFNDLDGIQDHAPPQLSCSLNEGSTSRDDFACSSVFDESISCERDSPIEVPYFDEDDESSDYSIIRNYNLCDRLLRCWMQMRRAAERLPDYVHQPEQLKQVVYQLTGYQYDDASIFALQGFLREVTEMDQNAALARRY